MYRIEVIDGVETMVPRNAPAPALVALPEDTIVLRPNKPLKVIKADEEPEVELEVEEIDPAWGTVYVPDPPTEPVDIPVKPSRDPALDLWKIGVKNEDADVINRFYKECLEKCDDETKTGSAMIAVYFNDWRDEKGIADRIEGASFNQLLFDFLAPRHKNKNKKIFFGVRIILSEEEQKKKDDMERMLREREAIKAELEERKRVREYNQTNLPSPQSSDEDEPEKKKEELKEVINWTHKKIHRHPELKKYGADLLTGEIFKLKGNKVVQPVSPQFKKGITNGGVVLSGGKDENGKRIQQYFSMMKFVAECGKLDGKTKADAKVLLDKECEAYKNRPCVTFYPLACLTYENTGGVVFNGDINRGVKSGNNLVSRCKTAKQIDEYIAGLKEQYEANRKADKLEIVKLKAENAKLEEEIVKLKQDCITPLKAGAIQLQELLMTEHQGSTVAEMLQNCIKDITRDYPKDDDRSEENFILELSPRGLFNRNEIITR